MAGNDAPAERPGAGRPRRRRPLTSVRYRLLLLFFAITAAAVGFVYLYVVPQLRSSLTAEKLRRLEDGAERLTRLDAAADGGLSQERLRAVVRRTSRDVGSRVTLLGVRGGPAGPQPRFVIADSELEPSAVRGRYLTAAGAAASGATRSGVETIDGERVGETAVPLSRDGQPVWVAVLSAPLDDVEDNVALIQRQILIAGGIALVAALVAAWLAAGAHSRRLRRLERAAEQVAEGNFQAPIPVESADEVGQLAKALNEMQERLARLDSARRDFIANASHELRTPIFSLGGFVELLEDEDPDRDSRREFVRTMREQIDRLSKLTVDLLDLSKLDADAIEITPEAVRLTELAEEVAGEFAPAAEHHRTTIEVQAPSEERAAKADRGRVAQIMRILIDNALTHTPEETAITITTRQAGGRCAVTVTDTGPGIDPRAQGRVFERFFTGDSVSGSGLGLAIARELARRMSGTLELSSRRGRTEFTLTLPIAVPASEVSL